QAIGSAVVLNVLLWLGLVISIPLRGFNPLYLTAAIVGVVVIGAFSGLVLLLTRGEDRAAGILRAVARRLPLLDVDTVDAVVRRLAQRVDALMSDRALVRRAILWATANWLLDAASLWVFVAAFGFRVGIDGLIVSYGLANVLAAIPITPGGLGVVEAVLTSSLVGFGSPRGVAILGVIGYRLVNFWLPIPLGGLASVSLRVAPGAPTKTKEELRRLAEEGSEEAEDARTWAARHGIKVGQPSDDAA
ncbi:MAG: YbhN family protein, partial [Actinomycetota bacterium]|nr:YbhN family protein [Actinomycetota bacterium]